jgi:hypothetical protein
MSQTPGSQSKFRGRAVFLQSRKITKERKVINLTLLLAWLIVSCSSQTNTLAPMSSEQTKNGQQPVIQGSGNGSSTSTLTIELSSGGLPAAAGDLLKNLDGLAIVDGPALVGKSPAGLSVVSLGSGQIGALSQLAPPAFASGKTFLPVRQDGSDFWLLEASSNKTVVSKPAQAVSLPLPAALPKHYKVSLDATLSTLGFGKDFLILKSNNSLWFVEQTESKITAAAVAFPQDSFSPIAAGFAKATQRSYWVADSTSVWLMSRSGESWSAKKFQIILKNTSGTLQNLAAILEEGQGGLKLSGPAVAMVNSKISVAGIETSPTIGKPPISLPESSPESPMPVAAMTFTQAAAYCSGCHATNATNAAAKAKLIGTENIITWTNNKDAIVAAVDSDLMPPSPLSEPSKASFLKFARDPR